MEQGGLEDRILIDGLCKGSVVTICDDQRCREETKRYGLVSSIEFYSSPRQQTYLSE